MKRSAFCNDWEFSRDGAPYAPVAVPHDAMLGNRRDAQAPAASASGYFYGASYRYRKSFLLTAEQVQGTLALEFEGVYRDACITVNGKAVEAPPYGFVPFFIALDGLVHAGENTIEVACSNADQPDCRWYSGAGIHRPVWLWEGGSAHILPEGVRVTTVSTSPAAVRVDVESCGSAAQSLHIAILDTDDATVAEAEIVPKGSVPFGTIPIPDAKLWNAEHPYLYRCIVELVGSKLPKGAHAATSDKHGDATDSDHRTVLDTAEVRFGIRMLEWGSRGLLVNGRETLLRGGCIHCDNGILGAASWPESEYRRIALLKGAGFNAVRIAHNPAPAALLDACDELGMYVMDETWDMWYTPKSRYDYSQHFLDRCDADLRTLAQRDYNHPSVVMYSIGNEVADPIAPEGVDLERSLVELLHALDPTRPVTCGLNLTMMVMERAGRGWYGDATGVSEAVNAAGEPGAPQGSLLFNLAAQAAGTGATWLSRAPGATALVSPALDALDIAGYNYASARYALDARKNPERVIVGSETFPHELARNWRLCEKIPTLIGDFMWAAWDYLGEAGAGAWVYTAEEAGFAKPWPWLLAGSGALDILGRPGAPAALAGAVWKTAAGPSIQVRPVNRMRGRTYKATWRGSDAIPSWSWYGCAGEQAEVEVYDGRAHAIRLELNGRKVGHSCVCDCMARFCLTYEPGTLEAIALDKHGHELGRSRLVSAQPPFHLEAYAERTHAPLASPYGIIYVGIAIAGANGSVESNFDEQLTATVEGGELLAFGSAQPAPTESYLDGVFPAYRGYALAIVHRAESGSATLTVQGTTLAPISIEA